MQNKALVIDARYSYFLEWKTVISLFLAVAKSFISVTLSFLKLSLFAIFDNSKSLSILKGP